jgi:acetoin utilization deacetylase AcuC-like enzyme
VQGGELILRTLQRLRNRLARRELPVWYSPLYRLPLSGAEAAVGIEPRRADYAAWWLVDSRSLPAANLRAPLLVSYEDLDRVHTPEFLESLGRPETLGTIFATHPSEVRVDEVMRTVRLACGATLDAARVALERRGPALNLLGGFHHAAPSAAGGLCPVNDVAVAVAALRAEGFQGRVAILDLDAHPPDGLAACLAHDANVWIGSLSGSDWGPLPGVDETVLADGTRDPAYLSALAALLGRMPRAALAFVLAGGDVLAGDRFGRLALTVSGARRRDLEVSRALDGLPAVWLPAGGYHADAWKVLAGTGMVLTSGSSAPIPDAYRPLGAHFSKIAVELQGSDLGDTGFSMADLEEDLGLAPRGRASRLLLGHYTAPGVEHALYRYGVFDFLQRIGYRSFHAEVDVSGPGDRVRVFGFAGGEEHLLLELIAERGRVRKADVLYVHWLSLRNPRARFTPVRPQLPGQDVPGLGLAREIGELLALIAQRLGLAGVVFRPAHYHTAYSARHNLAFVDAARQGRFEALVRDLAGLPLLEATDAVASGRVLLDGEPYAWEADEMALWLKAPAETERDAVIARERERHRFTLADVQGSATSASSSSRS